MTTEPQPDTKTNQPISEHDQLLQQRIFLPNLSTSKQNNLYPVASIYVKIPVYIILTVTCILHTIYVILRMLVVLLYRKYFQNGGGVVNSISLTAKGVSGLRVYMSSLGMYMSDANFHARYRYDDFEYELIRASWNDLYDYYFIRYLLFMSPEFYYQFCDQGGVTIILHRFKNILRSCLF